MCSCAVVWANPLSSKAVKLQDVALPLDVKTYLKNLKSFRAHFTSEHLEKYPYLPRNQKSATPNRALHQGEITFTKGAASTFRIAYTSQPLVVESRENRILINDDGEISEVHHSAHPLFRFLNQSLEQTLENMSLQHREEGLYVYIALTPRSSDENWRLVLVINRSTLTLEAMSMQDDQQPPVSVGFEGVVQTLR